jgi:hypothetical protein
VTSSALSQAFAEIMSWTFHSEASGDFRKGIVMPNWCENKLTITGPEKARFAFRHRVRGVGPRYKTSKAELEYDAKHPKGKIEAEPAPIRIFQFHSLVPVPQYLQERTYGGEEEAREMGLLDSPGPDFAGHDWEVENWSCKWGASGAQCNETESQLIYTFDTPWAPPLNFLMKASLLFPELTFRIDFQEPNMCFAGFAVIVNGELGECGDWHYQVDEEDEVPEK